MKYEILTYGDPRLRQAVEKVKAPTPEIRQLAADMLEAMRAVDGVGLAATQVGRPLALCVIIVPPEYDVLEEGGPRQNPGITMPLILLNPEIVAASREEVSQNEGCLSFPDIHVPVRRAVEVTLQFVDLDGARRMLTARHLLARAVQHELDHLRGVLLVDRMSPLKKISLAGQLKRLKLEGEEQAAGTG